LKICKKCIQPDTRPGLYFNEEGVCGACLWYEEKKTIDWDSRNNELKSIIKLTKKNSDGNYDCVIGVSGGKDSTWQALTARDRLGLRCLLVNCEPENITELGKQNIDNLKNLGFDVITIRPNPKTMKKLIKHDFYKYLNPVKVTEYALWASAYIIANKFNISLIIQGDNPAMSAGVTTTGLSKGFDALETNKQDTLSTPWEDYLEVEGISKNDLFLFHYDGDELRQKGIKGLWMNYFFKEWSGPKNADFARKNGLQFKSDDFDPASVGSYWLHSCLDSDLPPVNQMLKYIKFGFGLTTDQACIDFREGSISRDESIKLVKKYDGKCSEYYIEKFCNYIEITLDEFWETAEKFRGSMWSKKNNIWHNSYVDILNDL
jgi:N-acetyl sugar amidotransferase